MMPGQFLEPLAVRRGRTSLDGGGLDSLTDTIAFELTLEAGESEAIVATMEVFGLAAASASVPEPASLVLLLDGLAVSAARRRTPPTTWG